MQIIVFILYGCCENCTWKSDCYVVSTQIFYCFVFVIYLKILMKSCFILIFIFNLGYSRKVFCSSWLFSNCLKQLCFLTMRWNVYKQDWGGSILLIYLMRVFCFIFSLSPFAPFYPLPYLKNWMDLYDNSGKLNIVPD